MAPGALAQVLRPINDMFHPSRYPDLLRGLEDPDDALVWKLDSEKAIVQTADFFPPVVDDPYFFGAIAAANAISDLYAMGARPLVALNLVGFPDDLDPSILTEILRGGGEKVREAGAVVAGGHTTVDKEPKFGLSVTGLIHPDHILSKGGIREGDVMILTKPLGTGIVTTALKKQEVTPDVLDKAVASMARLSKGAAEIVGEFRGAIHAMTDITGFGFAGHAHEMAQQSGLALRFRFKDLPWLDGALDYGSAGYFPGGAKRNQSYYGELVHTPAELEEWERMTLFDPQTSGGLLMACDRESADKVLGEFQSRGEPGWLIGEAISGTAGHLEIV